MLQNTSTQTSMKWLTTFFVCLILDYRPQEGITVPITKDNSSIMTKLQYIIKCIIKHSDCSLKTWNLLKVISYENEYENLRHYFMYTMVDFAVCFFFQKRHVFNNKEFHWLIITILAYSDFYFVYSLSFQVSEAFVISLTL